MDSKTNHTPKLAYYNYNAHQKWSWKPHRNKKLKDLPISYLKWVVLNHHDVIAQQRAGDEIVRRDPKYRDLRKT